MIEDVYEPLARYRDEFKEEFARRAREKFEELTVKSGIDVSGNREQVVAIHRLEKELADAKSRCGTLSFWKWFGFIVGIAAAVFVYASVNDGNRETAAIAGVVSAVGIALGCILIGPLRNARQAADTKKTELDAAMDVAWQQMHDLNALYTWDIPVRLVEATVPRLQFDPFFSAKRLEDLRRYCGWDDAFNENKSIFGAQSGVINGNPFVFGEYMRQDWGEETYRGHLTIHWTEWTTDGKGRPRRVHRTQVLTATVTKPKPVYCNQKVLIYGNDAAPSLSFSRMPSDLSGLKDGFWTRMRKNRRLKKLRKFSQNLDDESQFTLMSNHEFETLFHAKDRDNEVEFRVLFTALAQVQMLLLMNDREVGFGDDFEFHKARKINLLVPQHLQPASIEIKPSDFFDWDYDSAAKKFSTITEKFFKDLYFAMAPLLAIPLYQQTRAHEDVWGEVFPEDESSFWEHEANANCHGDETFKHRDCITRSILKTRLASREDGVDEIEVTAYGFRGVERRDFVPTFGGDGCIHDVPVDWIEYLPVSRTSNMTLSENGETKEAFVTNYNESPATAFRHAIYSYLKVYGR